MILHPVPFVDPIAAFAPLAAQPWAVLLDSADIATPRGRWSFLALTPYRTLESVDGRVLLNGEAVQDDPFTVLARELTQTQSSSPPGEIPFAGGAIGFLGYELGRHLEQAPARHGLPPGQPEMAIGFYDSVAIFDLWQQHAWVSCLRPEATGRAQVLTEALRAAPALSPPSILPVLDWQEELDEAAYCDRVGRAIDYIAAGDIFQVNITGRTIAPRPTDLDPFMVYRHLRAVNPAPFAAYLHYGPHLTLVGASPERFLQLSADGHVEARPIKGTRPRATDPQEDRKIADELRASVKDGAENLMIADLLRNDIGRVAALGSVRAPVLCGLESFASVHHLVSVVEGRLRPGLGPVDLLRASFPGGSITGAPKVRAMEIIDELEPAPRGAYCGSVAWIGFDGAMDANIVIRTLVLTADQIIAQAGGGIVADSDPLAEYREMRTKITPALRIFQSP